MKQILILGGGAAGFQVAKTLERNLKPGEAAVTLVDARSRMIYQPLLAEVASGSIEPRHIQVPLRRHLPKTKIVQARVEGVNSAEHTVEVKALGEIWTLTYDILIVTLGGVTRTFPIPGVAENAIGLKTMEEAVYIRNKVISNFSAAESLPTFSKQRQRLLTYVIVGGGFSGVEGFAELRNLTTDLLKEHPSILPQEVQLHLIEATDRIMPEIPPERSQWIIDEMEKRNAHIHLRTQVVDATDGNVVTNKGDEFPTNLIVWTAGQQASPILANTDLPLDGRGRLKCREDLRVDDGHGSFLPDTWGCGDCCNVPDITGHGLPDGSCAPTAQHAVRQAVVLADNVVATLRGEQTGFYRHENAGMVAGLGTGLGFFITGDKRHTVHGFPAWLAHRGYHGMAVPAWERRARVFGDWFGDILLGRDMTSTSEVMRPRSFFEKYAAKAKKN